MTLLLYIFLLLPRPISEVDSLNNVAYELRRKESESSLLIARKALSLSEEIGYTGGYSVAALRVGSALMYLRRYEEAYAQLYLGIDFDLEHDYRSNLADKLNTLGIAFKNNGLLDSALSIQKRCLNIRMELKDSIGLAKSLNNIANIYRQLEYYESAFENLLASLAIKEHLGDYSGSAITKNNIANVLAISDKYTEARKYILENIEYYSAENRTKDLARCYLNLASLSFESSLGMDILSEKTGTINFLESSRVVKTEASLDTIPILLNHVIRIGEDLGDRGIVASALMLYGSYHQVLGKYDSSLLAYRKSESIYTDQSDNHQLAFLYNNLGDTYFRNGEYELAIEVLLKSYALSKEFGIDRLITETNGILARSYFAMDSAQLAYKFLQNHEILFYEELNRSKGKQLAELQTQYETEKKDKELQLRQARIELTTAQRDTLMSTLIVAVVLTAIIIFIYQQRQNAIRKLRAREFELHEKEVNQLIRDQELKSINSMLEGEEKERKRIAEDLHDRVGSMLSALRLQMDSGDTKVNTLLDETVDEVRRISHNLETKVLNRFGLAAALDDLAEKVQGSEKIKFEMHTLDLDERLENKVEINVYRIVQELISNALKHSRAHEIVAQINRIHDHLVVTVEDDGVGFNRLETGGSGMGLKNVISRANDLNGSFNVDSGQGKGTTVTVEIPL